MKNREEDIEVNLTGEETAASEASKSRWFKRIRKGIRLLLLIKRKPPKDFGQNVLPAIIFVPALN